MPGKQLTQILVLIVSAVVAVSAATTAHTADFSRQNRPLVVLLHGLGRSPGAMWLLAQRLEKGGFAVERIGYGSLTRSPGEIIADVNAQIDACCADHPQPVHFVGHSLGGLLIRAYLEQGGPSQLGRVVLIGTPNRGAELVDRYRDNCLFPLLGPMTAALGTDPASLPSRLTAPDYPVGIIAGVTRDGVQDTRIAGPDDGLVSIESTKLPGMCDFVIVEVGHSKMRYDPDVAHQTIVFLRHGHFAATPRPTFDF